MWIHSKCLVTEGADVAARGPSNCPYLLDILAASVDTFVITKQTHFLPVHLISVSEHWGKMGPDRCGLEF